MERSKKMITKRDICVDTGKLKYNRVNAGKALLDILTLNEYYNDYTERKEKHLYACPYCKAWHLTSQTGPLTKMYIENAKTIANAMKNSIR
jgi:hypothetical protein